MHKFIIVALLSICFSKAHAQTLEQATHLLDVWLEAQKDYNDWPSLSVSVVKDQDVVYSRSFGYSNPELNLEATPDTLYRIASNSKLFTAIAIMQLRDKSKLRLDDPVKKHLPWFNVKQRFASSDEITIESLLTHSSGLPYEPDIPYWSYKYGYPFPTRDELIEGTNKLETLYPAWERYQYSNLGFMLLGQVVENVSGQSYHQYVHENIITPMELNNTFSNIDESTHGHELAVGYGKLNRQRMRTEVPFVDAKATASAAGISSSANDLAKFLMWQLRTLDGEENNILRHHTLSEMIRPQAVNTGPDMDVGYGFRTNYRNNRSYIGHGGVYLGHTSQITIEPKQKIGGVALMNTHDMSPSLIVNRMLDVLGPVMTDDNTPSSHDFSEFQGIYDYQPWGDEVYMMQWGDQLVYFYLSAENPISAMSKFNYLGGDRFIRIQDDGGEADVMTFLRDEEGNIIGYKDQSDYILRKN